MGSYFAAMFNFGGTVISADTGAIVLSYLPMLLVAALASTPLSVKLYQKIQSAKGVPILQSVYCAGVLMLSTALLVGGSYNPFIYFRF